MLTVPQIIASVVFPRTASGIEQKALSNTIIVIARIFSQLFLLAFIAVAVIGRQFFTTVFGESFSEIQLTMLILIPDIFYLSVLALLSAYFAVNANISVNLYSV